MAAEAYRGDYCGGLIFDEIVWLEHFANVVKTSADSY